jgi:hypothetical protein
MPSFARAMLALVLGMLYLALAFVTGWEIGSLLVALFILGVVAFGAVAALATVLPVSKPWFYPVMFSFPALLIGLVAIGDNFSFFAVGLAGLFAGAASEYFVRWRARG